MFKPWLQDDVIWPQTLFFAEN